MPPKSVLIANRGEIACRIIRAAKRMGMRTIAVYSDADRDALHVRLADRAQRIGPPPASESYLSIENIVAAARASGAECLHPGYGFLSENAAFAQACADAGVIFVGPSPAAIRAMGLKGSAKALMQSAGVPVVQGYHGDRQEPDFLAEEAARIGYPVLVKAIAGGGGKGMRRVDRGEDFANALASARREARAAFGDDRVLIETYVANPRHVEMQIVADAHGNVLHLFERDCSLQRRHQKVIEEAPAPGMTAAMRAAMGEAAVRAARAVGYVGAGTVEFIADATHGLRPDSFWFMEMNTRLQVEHPVTEAILGIDLVELQFRVAAGERLPLSQRDVRANGHAVEARLYAEDPGRGFLPSSGRLLVLRLPEGEGVRVDAGVEEGDEVSSFYDPMIAKIIAHGHTRDEALDRLGAALARTLVIGPRCNVAFLASLVTSKEFGEARIDTGFVERHVQQAGDAFARLDPLAIAACVCELIDAERFCEGRASSSDPWSAADSFQLGPVRRSSFEIEADGKRMEAIWSLVAGKPRIELPELGFDAIVSADSDIVIVASGRLRLAWRCGRQSEVRALDGWDVESVVVAHSDGVVKAPMPGRLAALLVRQGERVEKGQRVAIVEAMKMEHVLSAPKSGTIVAVYAAVGEQVALHARIVSIEARGSS